MWFVKSISPILSTRHGNRRLWKTVGHECIFAFLIAPWRLWKRKKWWVRDKFYHDSMSSQKPTNNQPTTRSSYIPWWIRSRTNLYKVAITMSKIPTHWCESVHQPAGPECWVECWQNPYLDRCDRFLARFQKYLVGSYTYRVCECCSCWLLASNVSGMLLCRFLASFFRLEGQHSSLSSFLGHCHFVQLSKI